MLAPRFFVQSRLHSTLVTAGAVAAFAAVACSSDPGCESCSEHSDPNTAGSAGAPNVTLLPQLPTGEAGAPSAPEPDDGLAGAGGAGGAPSADSGDAEAGAGGERVEPELPAEGGAGGEAGAGAVDEPPAEPEARCGDRIVDAGEECDDGNASDDDECTSACKRPACGDGFTFLRQEQCDDGNEDDTDACRNDCTAAKCGDSVVHAGVEQCDDGNKIETDGCLSTCQAARCGDGVVHAGEEECDDANSISEDACVDCALPACGDGVVWEGHEECDDGGTESGDGCDSTCVAEPVALSLGMEHSCAILGDRRLKCWGDNTYGQVGPSVDTIVGDEVSELGANLPTLLEDVTAVGAAGHHTCAIQSGRVKCWGDNSTGQLGPSASGSWSGEPVSVDVGGEPVDVCVTAYSSFALLSDGSVRGWGTPFDASLPNPWTVPFSPGARLLTCGTASVCADTDHGVQCWGSSPLTSGTPEPMMVGVKLRDATELIQLSHGASQACAAFASGLSYCWGRDLEGQRFTGRQEELRGDVETDVRWDYVFLNMSVKSIVSGGGVSCAVGTPGTRSAAIKCWGYDTRDGALGQPDLTSVRTNHIGDTLEEVETLQPILLGDGLVPRVAATSGFHTCAVLTNGGLKCWGDNSSGQLAIGTDDPAIGDELGEMGAALRYSSIN